MKDIVTGGIIGGVVMAIGIFTAIATDDDFCNSSASAAQETFKLS